MNRSAQPLPSGARTQAGELSMPRHAISFWNWWDMSCDRCRGALLDRGRSPGDHLGEPARILAHVLADRLQGLEAGGSCMRVNADALGGAMIERDAHRGLAFAGEIVAVRSVPHIASTVSGMMVPS
jgi:hypothetical protein